MKSTPNGFDPLWVEAINAALADRESGVRIDDLSEGLWDSFLGPMLDEIEDGALGRTLAEDLERS